jgi:hypothetical protein
VKHVSDAGGEATAAVRVLEVRMQPHCLVGKPVLDPEDHFFRARYLVRMEILRLLRGRADDGGLPRLAVAFRFRHLCEHRTRGSNHQRHGRTESEEIG